MKLHCIHHITGIAREPQLIDFSAGCPIDFHVWVGGRDGLFWNNRLAIELSPHRYLACPLSKREIDFCAPDFLSRPPRY